MKHKISKYILTIAVAMVLMLSGNGRAVASQQRDIARYDSVRQLVRVEIRNRNYKSAISILNEFIDDTQSKTVKGQAQILLGNVHFALSDFYKANDSYEEAEALLFGTPNPKLEKKLLKARTKIVETELANIRQALEDYYSEHISYPKKISALLSRNQDLSIHDPWNRKYFYATSALDLVPDIEDQDYILYSQGLSGQERIGFQDRTARNKDILSQLEAKAVDKTGFPNNYRVKNISTLENGQYSAVLVSTGYLQETTKVQKGTILPSEIIVRAVLPEGVVMERNNTLGAVIYAKNND